MDADAPDWMVPADYDILDFFDEHRIRISPSIMAANIDLSRQYVSQRCQALTRAGLLFQDTDKLYSLTPLGADFLAGDVDPATLSDRPPDHYTGVQTPDGTYTVLADGTDLTRRLNYPDTEATYEWGTTSERALHLAHALITDVLNPEMADNFATQFMYATIADLPDTWELHAETIKEFVKTRPLDHTTHEIDG